MPGRSKAAEPEFDFNPTLLVIYTSSGAVAAYDPVKGNPFAKVKK